MSNECPACGRVFVCRPDWISVDDRLPEMDVKVLACALIKNKNTFSQDIGTARLYGKKLWIWNDEQNFLHPGIACVTHWMPLPETPKK